jgi:hypothetical protein
MEKVKKCPKALYGNAMVERFAARLLDERPAA